VLNILYPDYNLNKLTRNIKNQLPIHLSSHHLQVTNKGAIKVIALSDYSNKYVHDIIWTLKYNGDDRIVEILADSVQDYLLESVSTQHALRPSQQTFIIPIPLHSSRLRDRGFNQLHLILDKVADKSTELKTLIKYDILAKPKSTKSQTHLTRKERLVNIKGAFNVNDKKYTLNNAHVILIDDVLTTGATVSEACTTLLRSGVGSVEVLTIARRL